MDCLSTMEQLQFAADTRFRSSCSLLMIDNVANFAEKWNCQSDDVTDICAIEFSKLKLELAMEMNCATYLTFMFIILLVLAYGA